MINIYNMAESPLRKGRIFAEEAEEKNFLGEIL